MGGIVRGQVEMRGQVDPRGNAADGQYPVGIGTQGSRPVGKRDRRKCRSVASRRLRKAGRFCGATGCSGPNRSLSAQNRVAAVAKGRELIRTKSVKKRIHDLPLYPPMPVSMKLPRLCEDNWPHVCRQATARTRGPNCRYLIRKLTMDLNDR